MCNVFGVLTLSFDVDMLWPLTWRILAINSLLWPFWTHQTPILP